MSLTLYFSASDTIHSTSSLERRPLSFVIAMQFDLPVILSVAEMLRIPLVSATTVTSN